MLLIWLKGRIQVGVRTRPEGVRQKSPLCDLVSKQFCQAEDSIIGHILKIYYDGIGGNNMARFIASK